MTTTTSTTPTRRETRPALGARAGAVTLALVLAAAGAPGLGPAPAHAQDFSWTGDVEAGRTLEIRGVNGEIRATGTDGGRVEVEAWKDGRRSDPDDVRIEVVEHTGGVTICAVYPGRSDGRPHVCAPGDEARLGAERNDVSVEFEVRVPDGVRFVGRTVNGDVEARGLGSEARVSTVNGDAEVESRGFVEARTVNGSVRASTGSAVVPEGARFSTVNGSIDLDLPDDVDADVDASWVNGGLESDIPFQVTGRISRNSARGTLGAGGPALELKTVNGSIRIR